MKLPSLQYLAQSAGKSFLRFPCTVLSAVVGVGVGVYLTEFYDEISNVFPLINLMLTAGLGIGLFFCVDVYSNNKGYERNKRLLLDLIVFVILAALYFTLPDSDSTQNTSLPYIRYSIYAISIHLVVAFIPFLDKGRLNGFWNYNKILFLRFLASLLYSGFLYGGLALALGSLDFLFDIDLHNELFLDMFIVIAGLFNTWFFISGIPETFHSLEEIREYPKGIKIFSQYVLLPLLILYLLILYIYAGKIVTLWSWPKGIVSYLIACVAVLGILTLLLMFPFGNLSGNTWIKKFSKWYYFILFPLVILLFIAIGMRVADYGITINRYSILLLGVWLTIVCSYFSFGRASIKFIPVSLAIILVAVSFGYWGIFSVSERSQVRRLEKILAQGNILKDQKVQNEVVWRKDSLSALYATTYENANESVLNDSLHNEVMSIFDYLDDHHGFSRIRNWYHQDIDSIVKLSNEGKTRWSKMNEAEVYMRTMGLEYGHKYGTSINYEFTNSFASDAHPVTSVLGYDYVVRLGDKILFYGDDPISFNIDKVGYTLHYGLIKENLKLVSARDTLIFGADSLMTKLFERYGKKYQTVIPANEMVLHSRNNSIVAKIQLHSISVHSEGDSLAFRSLEGDILLKFK
jgi:hypothetical protein